MTFANETRGDLRDGLGRTPPEVERGAAARAAHRPDAPTCEPGGAFAGGTLARDILFLDLHRLRAEKGLTVPLIGSVMPSNETRKHWPVRRLVERLGGVKGRTVAVLGLAYKPGTDTLRRSAAIEVCRDLSGRGARVRALDPAVRDLPEEFKTFVTLAASAEAALAGADAAIVATEWPEFRSIDLASWLEAMPAPVICDPNGFLVKTFEGVRQVSYMSVGRP